jgi:uncharacterized protein YneF (UPF0154 family)
MRGATYMDLLSISVSLVALILGAAIGWLIARSRFMRTIAELNSKLVLERRVNKQLSETAQVQVDAVPSLIREPDLTISGEPMRESMVPSG